MDTIYWLTSPVLSINLFSAIQYPVIFIQALFCKLSSFSIVDFIITVHDLHWQQLTKTQAKCILKLRCRSTQAYFILCMNKDDLTHTKTEFSCGSFVPGSWNCEYAFQPLYVPTGQKQWHKINITLKSASRRLNYRMHYSWYASITTADMTCEFEPILYFSIFTPKAWGVPFHSWLCVVITKVTRLQLCDSGSTISKWLLATGWFLFMDKNDLQYFQPRNK